MKYTPPIMIDLSTGRHTARGQGPLGCIPGSAATGGSESCVPGNAAGYGCSSGGSAEKSDKTCAGGNTPYADCGTGTNPYQCVGGSGGLADPEGCRTGPLG